MTLVGRRDEAAALAALIETVRPGRSAAVVLRDEAGIESIGQLSDSGVVTERARARADEVRDQLTPQDQQVAQPAAEGRPLPVMAVKLSARGMRTSRAGGDCDSMSETSPG